MVHNGLTYYILADTIGSVRGIMDTSGNMVKHIDYDSYGNIISDSNPSMNMPIGVLYEKTESLISPIIAHIVFNVLLLLSVILLY